MGLEEKIPSGFLLGKVEDLAGWVRSSSMWPVTFGLACCAIEMMAAGAPRFDVARFGRDVQQLRYRAGRRARTPGRHLSARVPAPAGDAHPLDPGAARTHHQGRADGGEPGAGHA